MQTWLSYLVGLLLLAGMIGVSAPVYGQEIVSRAQLPKSSAKATLAIQVKVGDGTFRRKRAVSPLADETVRLRLKPMEGASIQWYLVFPDLSRKYANANPPWSDDPYKWVGVAPIDYYRVELVDLRGEWEVAPFDGDRKLWKPVRQWLAAKEQGSASMFYRDDVGTFRFQAVVKKDGKTWRTPGLEEVGDKGISKRVFRVSLRSAEGYLGYLTSFHNVPGVFGSVLYQSANYIGVDCADVLVAAYGKWRKKRIKKNYNVDMLVGTFRRVAKAELADGKPADGTPLSWKTDIRPGDLIAVKYEGSTRFQHIGALGRDADGDGLLSGADTVLHVGPYPLRESLMSGGAFDGHVVVLRPPGSGR